MSNRKQYRSIKDYDKCCRNCAYRFIPLMDTCGELDYNFQCTNKHIKHWKRMGNEVACMWFKEDKL